MEYKDFSSRKKIYMILDRPHAIGWYQHSFLQVFVTVEYGNSEAPTFNDRYMILMKCLIVRSVYGSKTSKPSHNIQRKKIKRIVLLRCKNHS